MSCLNVFTLLLSFIVNKKFTNVNTLRLVKIDGKNTC